MNAKPIIIVSLLFLVGCARGTQQQTSSTQTSVEEAAASSSVKQSVVNEQIVQSSISKIDAEPTSSSFNRVTNGGRFTVEYVSSELPEFQEWETYLRSTSVFEDTAAELNKNYKLPMDVHILIKECGEANAFYDPETHQIIMCYELFQDFADSFAYADDAEREQKITDAALSVFYHELGHTLIHELDLPVTGREEDDADQVSTLVLVGVGEEGEKAVLDGAEWFGAKGVPKKKMLLSAMSDVHSLDLQRFYNIVCWVYGADPENTSFSEYYSPFQKSSRATKSAVIASKNRIITGKFLTTGCFFSMCTSYETLRRVTDVSLIGSRSSNIGSSLSSA